MSSAQSAGAFGLRLGDWLLAGALALVLTPGWLALSAEWSRVDYYSHGPLIPLVAIWAGSTRRNELRRRPAQRDARGGAVLIAALVGYVLALAAGLAFWVGVCMVAAVAGALLLARGAAWLRALAFPVGYLLFMAPIPASWLAPVIGRLQLWVSAAGAVVLGWLDVPVLRSGNVLEIAGGEELFVAEACSGITSLVTLIPLGVFLAYLMERTLARRLVLVASVVPVALAGNLTRVVATVVMAGRIGVEAATRSALHDWVGIGTYVIACLVLVGVADAMRRWLPPSRPSAAPSAP